MAPWSNKLPFILALTFPTTAWAGGTAVVAPLVAKGVDQKIVNNVTGLLSSELDFSGAFDTVNELASAPSTLNAACLSSTSCLQGIGKAASADAVIAGSVAPGSAGVQVFLVYYDVKKNTIIRKKTFDAGGEPSALAEKAPEWVKEITTGESAAATAAAEAAPSFSSDDEDDLEIGGSNASGTTAKTRMTTTIKPGELTEEDDEDDVRAEAQAKADADAKAKAKAAADAKARAAAEAQARAAADAKAAADARAAADAKAAAQAKAEAAARAKAEAEARAAAQAKADAAAKASASKSSTSKPASDEEFSFGSAASSIQLDEEVVENEDLTEDEDLGEDDSDYEDSSSSKSKTSSRSSSSSQSTDLDEDPAEQRKREDAERRERVEAAERARREAASRTAAKDLDEEEPTVSKSRTSSRDEDEDEDEPTVSKSRTSSRDEDEEESTSSRSRSSSRDEDEEEEESTSSRSRSTASKDLDEDDDEDTDSRSSRSSSSRSSSSRSSGKDEKPGVSLTGRLGYSRYYDFSFVTYGGELTVPITPNVMFQAGLEGFSTQRELSATVIAQLAKDQDVSPADINANPWNTILPINLGIQYKLTRNNIRPYFGADLTITPYTPAFDVALGARARVGADFMLADAFGLNLNLSAGVMSGKNLEQTQPGTKNTGFIPQLSGGTVFAF